VLAVVGTTLADVLRRRLAIASALVAGGLALALLSAACWMLLSGEYTFSRLPHLRGILLKRYEEARLQEYADGLPRLRAPVLIVAADASAMYLVSGVRNPTPYDYVIKSELPPGAQEKMGDELRTGKIATAVVFPSGYWYSPLFEPDVLMGAVERACAYQGNLRSMEVWVGKGGVKERMGGGETTGDSGAR